MKKISVGVLGATGMVGQHYLRLLANHPWFEVNFLASSEQSAGKTYAEAVEGRWRLPENLPIRIWDMPVRSIDELAHAKSTCRLVFSAITADAARKYEALYAENGIAVVSNASYHRSSSDVPVLVPEINPEHIHILPHQQKKRGWKTGFIVAKPNCSVQSYMIPLSPLHRQFKVLNLIVTTMQAVSGSGYPGVSSLDIVDNVIPYIAGEEEKSEQEPLKIWGNHQGNAILPATGIALSAHCNRVPVIDGHLACVSVRFNKKPLRDEVLDIWRKFKGVSQQLQLPSAPTPPVIYREEQDRPQPRQDRDAGSGMAVTVGRLRDCPVFDYRFVALSHNTIRGAAGGGILNAELLFKQGYLE